MPTPVSSLIHAATLVTAGLYLLMRSSPILEYSSTALFVITIIGSLTSFFAASTGLLQNDIKRIIAMSTISQLGYAFGFCFNNFKKLFLFRINLIKNKLVALILIILPFYTYFTYFKKIKKLKNKKISTNKDISKFLIKSKFLSLNYNNFHFIKNTNFKFYSTSNIEDIIKNEYENKNEKDNFFTLCNR